MTLNFAEMGIAQICGSLVIAAPSVAHVQVNPKMACPTGNMGKPNPAVPFLASI